MEQSNQEKRYFKGCTFWCYWVSIEVIGSEMKESRACRTEYIREGFLEPQGFVDWINLKFADFEKIHGQEGIIVNCGVIPPYETTEK